MLLDLVVALRLSLLLLMLTCFVLFPCSAWEGWVSPFCFCLLLLSCPFCFLDSATTSTGVLRLCVRLSVRQNMPGRRIVFVRTLCSSCLSAPCVRLRALRLPPSLWLRLWTSSDSCIIVVRGVGRRSTPLTASGLVAPACTIAAVPAILRPPRWIATWACCGHASMTLVGGFMRILATAWMLRVG